jgi:S-DNA-T family DNA segregation ATPase FtsK/SpoIIIE
MLNCFKQTHSLMRKKNTKNKDSFDEFSDTELPFQDDENTVLGRVKNIFAHVDSNLTIYLGIFFLFLSVFSLSAVFGLSGEFGRGYFNLVTANFGAFTYLAPLIYLGVSAIFLTRSIYIFFTSKFWSIVGLLLSVFVLIGFIKNADGLSFSGIVGGDISLLLKNSVGTLPSVFILITTSLVTLARIFETSIEEIFRNQFSAKKHLQHLEQNVELEIEEVADNVGRAFGLSSLSALNPLSWFSGANALKVKHSTDYENYSELNQNTNLDQDRNTEETFEEVEIDDADNAADEDVRSQMYKAVSVDMPDKEVPKKTVKKIIKKEVAEDTTKTKKENQEKIKVASEAYRRPPVSIYSTDSGKSSAGDNKENARIIKRTLSDFGISVEMDEVTVGPTVTRYALKPAQGVKIEKIMNLANNIALELGVSSVSISRVMERSLIGIEVPNKQKSKLGLGSLLEKKEFLDRPERLTVAIGKDIYGDAVFSDMAKMPHLLIAGTTGSGKSSLMHVLINSLIFKNSPYDLKFIMIDPKKVEFALYNNLPHLYTPVIKDPKKAIQTLNWLVQEMDRRYQMLEEIGKQNINAYHAYVADKYNKAIARGTEQTDKLPEKLPFIVLVIDELADFMMKYPKEMESGIVKLAQMSRAVGIHLILATQRPSTNVITGVIKGNIPSRVALRVASQVDSRVIIDQGGAEKLLGYGDLLFVSSDGSDTKRIQSPFVQEDEIKEAVSYLRRTYDDVVAEDLKTPDGNIVGATNLNASGGSGPVSDESFNEEDDKYEEAKQVVLQTKKTSISNLQVRLGTGYARSAKLINMLEQAGVIISTTDNSGKQIKVVAGTESEKLEAQADKLLSQNSNRRQSTNQDNEEDYSEEEEMDDTESEEASDKKTDSGFFKF